MVRKKVRISKALATFDVIGRKNGFLGYTLNFEQVFLIKKKNNEFIIFKTLRNGSIRNPWCSQLFFDLL